MDKRAWWAIVHWVTKSWTWLSMYTHIIAITRFEYISLCSKVGPCCLSIFHIGIILYIKHPFVIATTLFWQHKRRLYTWTSPDGQYRNQTDYILCSQRWRSSIQSAKTRPGADCASDHELLIAKFRLKLKKVGKTTRPFRYDLNQIPYNYIVEVTNRFQGLDLIDRVPEELWTEICELYRRQGSIPSPRKINTKRQNGCLRRHYE